MLGNHVLHLSQQSDDEFYFGALRAHGWIINPATNLANALRSLTGKGFSLGVMRLKNHCQFSAEQLNIFLDAAGDVPWIAVVDPELLSNESLSELIYSRCANQLVCTGDQASLTFALGQIIAQVAGKEEHPAMVMDLRQARDAAEKQAIETALVHFPGNMTKAATQLGISRMTLYRLLHKHGLAEEHTRSA